MQSVGLAWGASSIYHSFLKEQLTEQEARKSSLERGGIAIITTSGTLASLLLAFAALVTASDDFVALTSSSRAIVVAATIAFAVAALAAVATNFPLLYASVRTDQMRALVRETWADDQPIAEQRIASTFVSLIAVAKKLNTIKGWLLFGAMTAETIAVMLLAIAVGVILA